MHAASRTSKSLRAASGMAAAGRCTIAEIDDVKLAVSEVLLALIEHGSGRTLSVSMQLADSTFVIAASTAATRWCWTI